MVVRGRCHRERKKLQLIINFTVNVSHKVGKRSFIWELRCQSNLFISVNIEVWLMSFLFIIVSWFYLIMWFICYIKQFCNKLSNDTYGDILPFTWTLLCIGCFFWSVSTVMNAKSTCWTDESASSNTCSALCLSDKSSFTSKQHRQEFPLGITINLQADTDTHWGLTGGLTHTYTCSVCFQQTPHTHEDRTWI